MKTRSRLAVLGTGALVLLSTVVVSSPANATISDCNVTNRACAWIANNYSGLPGMWSSSASTLPGWDNQISSIRNRKATNIGRFSGTGYSGNVFVQAPGEAGFFNWPDTRNDSFSSLFVY